MVELAKLIFTVCSFVLAAAANIYAWYATRTKARQDEVDGQIDEVRGRLQLVERDLHHSPSQEQIQNLHARIGEVHGELREISGKLGGINRLVDLVNEHLISQGSQGRDG